MKTLAFYEDDDNKYNDFILKLLPFLWRTIHHEEIKVLNYQSFFLVST